MQFDEKAEQVLRALSLQDAEFENLIRVFVSYGSRNLVLPNANEVCNGVLLHLIARVVMLEQTVDELLLGEGDE